MDNSEGFSQSDISIMMLRLVELYGEDLELYRDIRHMIDAVFHSNSNVIIYKAVLYLMGFFIPFVYQMLFARSAGSVLVLNIICLITQLMFLIFAGITYK